MSMFEKYPDVVTVKDLCAMLKIGKNTAYKIINGGDIQSVRIGRKFLIPKCNVIAYLSKIC